MRAGLGGDCNFFGLVETGHDFLHRKDHDEVQGGGHDEEVDDGIKELADVQLADGSSGLDAVNDILRRHDIPVIFITAFPGSLLTGGKSEPAFLVVKPFREEELRAVIGQALFFHMPQIPQPQRN